jgi:hypothetical protein
MKMSEFEDAVFYKAQCNCMDDTCTHTIELEMQDLKVNNVVEHRDISLNFYTDCYLADYFGKDRNLISKMWFRIKYAFILIFTGKIMMEQYFMFNGKKAIQDYIDALQEGINKLDELSK